MNRMTAFEWIESWWRRTTSGVDAPPTGVAAGRSKVTVPVEYRSLYTYLDRRYASTVVLTFEQMESLLGFALPDSAGTDLGWWTEASAPLDRHSDAWIEARRTATPNLQARNVAFERLP